MAAAGSTLARRAVGRHPRRRALLLMLDALVLVIGLGAYALLVIDRQGTPTTPAMGYGVALHPRTLPIAGLLSDGREMTGTIYPASPGLNTLHLTLRGGIRPLAHTEHLNLVITMLGMPMIPTRAQLAARDSGYTGIVRLPMVGAYQARVTLGGPMGSVTGAIRIDMSAPRS